MSGVDVVGVGIYSSLGIGIDKTWEALSNEVQEISLFATGLFAHLTSVPVTSHKLPRLAELALLEAMGEFEELPEAIFVGSSSDSYSNRERGHPKEPTLARDLASKYAIGRRLQFSNACAASSYAIAHAMDEIRMGHADLILVGGADEVTTSSIVGFKACRIYDDECRPFHPDRKGLVLGDGAAFLLLSRRGMFANPIARLTGVGLTGAAGHMTNMSHEPILRAMSQAMNEAEVDDVDLVMAHGTGTQVNDAAESSAIAHINGVRKVASYKRWMGHPQGASGAIGVALAIESIRRQEIFCTSDAVDVDLEVSPLVTYGNEGMYGQRALVLSHGTWDVYSAIVVEGVPQ